MVYHYGWTAYSKVLQWDITLVHGQNFLFIRAISEKETNKQNINICMKNNFTRKNTHFFLFLLWNIYIIPTATDPRRWNNNFTKKRNNILKYLMEEKTSTFQCSLSGVVFGTNNFFLFDTYLPQTYFDKLNDHWNIYYILLTKEK